MELPPILCLPIELTNKIFSYLDGKVIFTTIFVAKSFFPIMKGAIEENHVPLKDLGFNSAQKAIDFTIAYKINTVDLQKFDKIEISKIIRLVRSNLELTSVMLNLCEVEDERLKTILKFSQNLKLLDLRFCLVSGEKFHSDNEFGKMETLKLYGCPVTDKGLENLLKFFPNLQTLSLGSTKISDSGLVALEKTSHLKSLNMTSTSITNEGVKLLLEKLLFLKMIFLSCTKVNNEVKPLGLKKRVKIFL